MKNYISFLFLLLSFSLFAQTDTPTKVYLVRHTEKITDDPKEKDPLLTMKGTTRAVALAQVLKNIPLIRLMIFPKSSGLSTKLILSTSIINNFPLS